NAAGTLIDAPADDVRLLEVRVCSVEDERLAILEGMVEEVRETRIPPLRHPRRVPDCDLLLRIVVDIEVVALKDAEVEGAVLDLVAAEVLSFKPARGRERQDEPDEGKASSGDRAMRVVHAGPHQRSRRKGATPPESKAVAP